MSGERDREQAKQWDDIIVSIAQFADDRITIGCLRRDLKKFAEAYAASLRERNAQLEAALRMFIQTADSLEWDRDSPATYQCALDALEVRGAQKGAIHPHCMGTEFTRKEK